MGLLTGIWALAAALLMSGPNSPPQLSDYSRVDDLVDGLVDRRLGTCSGLSDRLVDRHLVPSQIHPQLNQRS